MNAMDACVLPNPQALDCYYGATTPDIPVSFPPSWCSVINNNQWFAFTADATTATFNISCYGCASGNGIQAAVLSTADCVNFQFVSPCLGGIATGTTQILNASNLVPGEVYYLCIDGSGGALCDYSINGSIPVVNPPNGDVCIPSSPTATYTTSVNSSWTINPPSAGTFVGNPVGASVTVTWLQPGPATLCAQNINCPNAPQACLDINVGEDTETIEMVDLCQGKTVTCAGKVFNAPGTFPVILQSFTGCDSTVKCMINLIPTVTSTETVLLCQGQSVSCAGKDFTSPGNFPVILTAPSGCDSIVTCKVTLIPTYVSPFYQVNLCGPAEYQMCDNVFTSSGLFTEKCVSSLGCDSIVNVNLAILDPEAVIVPPAIIDCGANSTITLSSTGSNTNNAVGGSTLYQWTGPGIIGSSNQPTVQVNQPGNYCLILTHGRGGLYCADTACVTVSAVSAVPQLPQITGNPTPCGDSTVTYTATAVGTPAPTSYTWTTPGNIPFTSVGLNAIQITWNSANPGGPLCVTANNSCGPSAPACLPITVLQPVVPPDFTGPDTVCANGGAYAFVLDSLQPGTTYNWTIPTGAALTISGDSAIVNFTNAVSGQVCVTAQNNCGILGPLCQNVQVIPTATADISGINEICLGESLDLTFTLSGNAPFNVTWTIGNQSLVLNNISSGYSIPVNPTVPTTYRLISVESSTGLACPVAITDSVHVQVWQPANINLTAQICEGESILLGGAMQTTSGIYSDSLSTIHGCDSVIVTILTVNEIDSILLLETTCDPAAAGTTTTVFSQTNGCDSVVTRTVTLLPTDTTLIFDTNCDPANVGVFVQNLTNQYGCDSTVTTTVTFSLSDTTYLSSMTCNVNGTGVFVQNFTTVDGCDSLIITTVTLTPGDTTLLTDASCDPAGVGVFVQTLLTQAGCDSTVITTVSLLPSDSTFLFQQDCDPADTGVFVQNLTNQYGCDSTVVTTVSLLPSDTTLLFDMSCNPANVGVFTDVLTNQYGCDSTLITTVSFFQIDTTFLFSTTCDLASAGVFTEHVTTSGGCDSTIVTTVALLPSNQVAIQSSTCDPAAAGIFTYDLTNQFGCDSTVTETVTLLPSDSTFLSFGTCDPALVGTVIDVQANQWGCDSTIISITSLLPPASCGTAGNITGSTIPCGSTTGSLTVLATLGEPPFSFTVLLGTTPVASGNIAAVGVPQTVNGLAAGNYTLNLSSANGFSTTAQATIVQLIPPVLAVNQASNYNGFSVSCTGASDGSALASATGGTQPFAYSWSNSQQTAQINNLGVGSYSVTVTDATGCTAAGSVSLNEPEPLQITFKVNDLDCFGQNDGVIFIETSGGVPPYRFTLNNSASQISSTFTGLAADTYTVTASDANDCETSETILVNAAVLLDVDLGDDQSIELGTSTILQAVVNVPLDSILSVAWTPPFDTSECPGCLTQTVAPFVSTTYSVEVVAQNGCTDRDKIIVAVDRRRYLYIPNIFSPNGDGSNDLFSIQARPGTVSKIKSLQLFDRWGEAVYTLYDFVPNDPAIGWGGKFGSQQMNPGVFAWVMEVEFIDGVIETFAGDVTLMR
ncbi:MAG: gliding motility-associated C-terminal domain-containing protein [Lewinellaceae bacterium]|nr:gliding motility-associated C-terminal domain-containing protein [Lewinellaceae bacterium]